MTDILALIDDAVGQRCACGTCLDERSASMWFASPECQRVYHERTTTEPYDVYNRPDAGYFTDDGASWTANPQPTTAAARVRWAPVGTDPRDESQWQDISGYLADEDDWRAANPAIGVSPDADVVARFMAEAGVDLSPWQRQVVARVMGIPVHQLDPHRPVFILAASTREAEEVARIWELPRSRWRQITDRSSRLRGTRRAQVIVTECWREHVPWRAAQEIDYLLRDTDAEVIYVPCP